MYKYDIRKLFAQTKVLYTKKKRRPKMLLITLRKNITNLFRSEENNGPQNLSE